VLAASRIELSDEDFAGPGCLTGLLARLVCRALPPQPGRSPRSRSPLSRKSVDCLRDRFSTDVALSSTLPGHSQGPIERSNK
jgi:hypothetical protein